MEFALLGLHLPNDGLVLTYLKVASLQLIFKFFCLDLQVFRVKFPDIALDFLGSQLGCFHVCLFNLLELLFVLIFAHLFLQFGRLLSLSPQIYLQLCHLLPFGIHGNSVTVDFRITFLKHLILHDDMLL